MPADQTAACPKCDQCHGNDWSQCEGACPMPMSPHYKAELAAVEWQTHMTPDEAARWAELRARSASLAAERAAVTDETNRLRQRVMQRALYRKRKAAGPKNEGKVRT